MKHFYLKVDEANQAFDDLKMQGDHEGMLELLKVNREMLTSAGWDIPTLETKLNTVIKLLGEI